MRRLAVAALAALALPASAAAAPPPNDAPSAPADFEEVTAANGQPDERQGIAELAEATADQGVPACLGDDSFARTVWFRVPAADAAREVQIEASGRTSDVVDLAVFVQPAEGANTAEPNACAGVGVGGADLSEDPTSGVVLRVPGGRSLLVQVGRRGERGNADDERALLSLATRDLPAGPQPAGDRADDATPTVALGGGATQEVPLGGATTSEEDPAVAPCPSLGGVWRRHVPGANGPLTVVATGSQVGAVTVFSGRRPSARTLVDCTPRERSAGEVAVVVPRARRGRPVWIRLGTDRPPAEATGTVRVVRGARAPQACAASVGFRTVAVRPVRRGRRVALRFRRTTRRAARIDVFQVSAGRRVLGQRLVARFTRRRSFTWRGRANRRGRRVSDGIFFVRLRTARPGGGTDTRRVVLQRRRGRFRVRPAFYQAAGCALVRSFKLTRPVFGGRTNRALGATFRSAADGRAVVHLVRRGRVVKRLARRSVRKDQPYRVRIPAERRRRGDYTIRLTLRAHSGRTAVAELVSRRL